MEYLLKIANGCYSEISAAGLDPTRCVIAIPEEVVSHYNESEILASFRKFAPIVQSVENLRGDVVDMASHSLILQKDIGSVAIESDSYIHLCVIIQLHEQVDTLFHRLTSLRNGQERFAHQDFRFVPVRTLLGRMPTFDREWFTNGDDAVGRIVSEPSKSEKEVKQSSTRKPRRLKTRLIGAGVGKVKTLSTVLLAGAAAGVFVMTRDSSSSQKVDHNKYEDDITWY